MQGCSLARAVVQCKQRAELEAPQTGSSSRLLPCPSSGVAPIPNVVVQGTPILEIFPLLAYVTVRLWGFLVCV